MKNIKLCPISCEIIANSETSSYNKAAGIQAADFLFGVFAMDRKNEKSYRILVSTIAILLIALLIWLVSFLIIATNDLLTDNPLTKSGGGCIDMLEGWTYENGSEVECFEHQTAALLLPDPEGNVLLTYTLPCDIPDSYSLFFRSDCHVIKLTCNGQSIYTYEASIRHTSETDMFREFSIALPKLQKGDVLSLHLRADGLDKLRFQFPCCGEENAVKLHIFRSCSEAFIIALIAVSIIIVGLFVYFYHLWHGKNHTEFLCIVLFAAVSFFWICSDTGLAVLFLPYNLTLYFMNYSLPLLLLVIFFLLVQTAVGKKLKGFFAVSLICLVTLLVGFVLHFVGVISLRRQLPYVTFVMLFAGIICSVILIRSLPQNMIYFTISSVLLTLITAATAYLYFRLQMIQSTILFRYALALFSVVMLVILIRGIHKLDQQAKQSERLQREKEAAEAKMLLTQINSHFFYNTINTIRGLIKYDPDNAYKMIGDFGKYVRYRVNSSSNGAHMSTFKEELRAIRAYADICVIRLNGKLDIQYDIESDDFYIPTLTVEPFVENAIHHGIYHGTGEGNVCIRAKKQGGFWEVTVTDNGCGFDSASLDKSQSVGIYNIPTRLAQYSGSHHRIEITPGKGTCVTIRYPDTIGGQDDETDSC